MTHKDNILIIADTHLPFELPNYLDFCLEIKNRVKCGTVVHIGDLVDNHAISYHEHDPDGKSPLDEIIEVKKHLTKWFKTFPKLYLCRGNHDRMVDRKGRTVGLPTCVFKPFREIWELPKEWKDDFSFELFNVTFEHGTGYSGDNAHMKAAYNNRQSTVIGHTHSQGAVGYLANEKDCIFGMNVGSGINRRTYAFEYGRDFKKKPIIGCGVVTDNGRFAQFFPMDL
jgi:predicted phosphodiesterase